MKKLAQWIEFEIKIPDFKNSQKKLENSENIFKRYNLKYYILRKNQVEPYYK